MILRFLATTDRFDPPHSDTVMWPETRGPIQGIGLPEEVVRAIVRDNALALLGGAPNPFDEKKAQNEVQRLAQAHGPDSTANRILARWDD